MPLKQVPHALATVSGLSQNCVLSDKHTRIERVPFFRDFECPASGVFDRIWDILSLDVLWLYASTLVKLRYARCTKGDGRRKRANSKYEHVCGAKTESMKHKRRTNFAEVGGDALKELSV